MFKATSVAAAILFFLLFTVGESLQPLFLWASEQ